MIEKLLPKTEKDFEIEEIERKYPPRQLKEGMMVTRIAPSPTGFMHIGSLYTALVSERLAHQTGGVFYLRIEDTDKKREVEGAVDLIINSMNHFGVKIDEGENIFHNEIGEYGPYKQSERREIYKAYVKLLLEKELAYPCFCSPEELEDMRKQQEKLKVPFGYYGKWAKWRNQPKEDVQKMLNTGRPFAVRFRSNGNSNKKIIFDDIIKGKRELPENNQDIIIMKSDGLPTYHMAHVVDDHLMGTTHVLRGDEWFSSVPIHVQLFEALGWKPPRYGHLMPIQKNEGASKRKLSKRKDPEASVAYYDEQGYPQEAVVEYLINLANSSFEDWRKSNQDKDYREFSFSLEKLTHSNGALFDMVKLNDISKDVVSRFTAEEMYVKVFNWAQKYDKKFSELMEHNTGYVKDIMNIERGDETKKRKDIAKWSEVRKEIEYFFDELFFVSKEDVSQNLKGIDFRDTEGIIKTFVSSYNEDYTKDEWFDNVKKIAKAFGYAESTKTYKQKPDQFKGSMADVAKIFRVLLTGRVQTPDLYSIIKAMGKDRVLRRLSALFQFLPVSESSYSRE
ncbi:MAG: glutamate--tRNA ligase [Candidatus Paceibacter sp.]|nr:glutamate--tRNA ligase [Candidatus Paceibacter sp.]